MGSGQTVNIFAITIITSNSKRCISCLIYCTKKPVWQCQCVQTAEVTYRDRVTPAHRASRPPAGTSWPIVWGTTRCPSPSVGSAALSDSLWSPWTPPLTSATQLTATWDKGRARAAGLKLMYRSHEWPGACCLWLNHCLQLFSVSCCLVFCILLFNQL